MWSLFHDGKAKGPKFPTYGAAWIRLFGVQPQSASYAFKYGGWEIRRVSRLTRKGRC